MTLVRVLAILSLVVLGSTPGALAATPEVRDQAGFFSKEAVQKANRELEEIRRQYGKELVIETYAEPPADVAAQLTAKEPRDRVYAEWVQKRATDAGVNGIYVLITRNPAHLQLAVGNETRKAAFTNADRDKLRDLLLNAFRQKKYDEGLAEAIALTRRTLDLNVGSRPATARPVPAPVPAPQPSRERASDGVAGFSWTTILIWGGLILFVLWLVGRMMRNRAAEANRLGGPGYGPGAGPGVPGPGMPGYGYGPSSGGGGGGFGRGLLGGLLGGVAGGYLYDRMRGGGEAQAGGHGPTGGGFDQPGGAPDTDFSSSGGDFGGDAGGDTGGGDFGGGDSGGSSD
jgi:uncharacterized membrane protein YgcG